MKKIKHILSTALVIIATLVALYYLNLRKIRLYTGEWNFNLFSYNEAYFGNKLYIILLLSVLLAFIVYKIKK